MNQFNNRVVLLLGPTATGKTELALRLAELLPIEIISVDSVLVYKDMNIGTAKPTREDLGIVPHHLIDLITPLEAFSVAKFLELVIIKIHEVLARNRLPVLVGGTMMYFNALINGISKLPTSTPDVRDKVASKLSLLGLEVLYEELLHVDAEAASKIKNNDTQRILRALEVYEMTGVPLSVLQKQDRIQLGSEFNFLPLAIIPIKRDILHERIEFRFKRMLDEGLVDEVLALQVKYPELKAINTSQRTVGYAQVWQYLAGEITENELYDKAVIATRGLAKRQITWLRSMAVVNITDDDLHIEQMLRNLHAHIIKEMSNTVV